MQVGIGVCPCQRREGGQDRGRSPQLCSPRLQETDIYRVARAAALGAQTFCLTPLPTPTRQGSTSVQLSPSSLLGNRLEGPLAQGSGGLWRPLSQSAPLTATASGRNRVFPAEAKTMNEEASFLVAGEVGSEV